MADNILSDFGIGLLDQEIDDVIFQTNEFLCDATFTGSQGPFWWILQMSMALAALFSLIVAGSMAYKMMVKNEPLDIMKLFRPLAIAIIMCCRQIPEWQEEGNGVCLISLHIYLMPSAHTHMICMRLKPHKFRINSRKYKN